ncbi:Uncharacterized conserved protein YndB, AHSA1/START domain [Chitinophaga ginsengisegetis]|uniref:Uncharacterized conserved protein YndB, AHSA1/START domain n=1 Tax=Chitinophaga ginsengisegetis TaxID=393003 RepID=A0A1T5P8L1_9BACT|nr:SRPBCC domain-containing protein [Chitinophaga ginsengisegetis]SKD09090.1 Uncharacterized conserved protein YndB, AHSA1/START domain [Chitinophaga ginsengisegetis]
MEKIIERKIMINAPVAEVWNAITDIKLMTQWMGEAALDLRVVTTWEVGAPLVISGFHHARFENKGTVLEYSPDHAVSYDFLSSLSRLPDSKENYTVIRFALTPQEEHTLLTLTLTNFPTDTIYQHLSFYWNGTLGIMKKMIEG